MEKEWEKEREKIVCAWERKKCKTETDTESLHGNERGEKRDMENMTKSVCERVCGECDTFAQAT